MVTVEEYSRTVQVASYEVGANEKIKLSVLLRMAQETSEQHLGELGIGYEPVSYTHLYDLKGEYSRFTSKAGVSQNNGEPVRFKAVSYTHLNAGEIGLFRAWSVPLRRAGARVGPL